MWWQRGCQQACPAFCACSPGPGLPGGSSLHTSPPCSEGSPPCRVPPGRPGVNWNRCSLSLRGPWCTHAASPALGSLGALQKSQGPLFLHPLGHYLEETLGPPQRTSILTQTGWRCTWRLIHPDGAGVLSSPRAAPQRAWGQREPPVPPRLVRLWGLVYCFCFPTERCRGAVGDTPSSIFALSPQWWPGHRQLLLMVGQVGPTWGPCP